MASFWKAATSNAFNTTLNGSIGSTDTTITLNSATNLQSPGVLVIDRTDGAGNSTPALREYITFTAVNSNQLTGVVRGVAGSTAQAHNSGAQVEEVMSITHWNDLVTIVSAEHNSAGHHVIGTATIAYAEVINLAVTSIASIAQLNINSLALSSVSLTNAYISTLLSVSGASVQGFPIRPAWYVPGTLSGATTNVGSPMAMPDPANIKWISVVLQQPASQASLQFDIKKNFASVLGSSNVLTVPINGTYVSTASIATTAFIAGDIISVDVSNVSSFGGNAIVQIYAR